MTQTPLRFPSAALVIVIAGAVHAQTPFTPHFPGPDVAPAILRDLEGGGAHYLDFSQLNGAPGSSGLGTKETASLDKLRFKDTPDSLKFVELKASAKAAYVPYRDGLIVLAPPPANSSARTKAEIAYLLKLQSARTFESNRAVYENDLQQEPGAPFVPGQPPPNMLFFVGRSLGPWFSRAQMPATRNLLDKAMTNVGIFCFEAKKHFGRARPYEIETKITSLVGKPPHPSYPSAHGCVANTLAFILEELAPKHRDVFFNDALEISLSREWGGIHYPSDDEAGRVLARQFVDLAWQSTEFQKDFAKAKAEWKGK